MVQAIYQYEYVSNIGYALLVPNSNKRFAEDICMSTAKCISYLPLAYVVRREGTVFTGVCLSTSGGGGGGYPIPAKVGTPSGQDGNPPPTAKVGTPPGQGRYLLAKVGTPH